MEDKLTMGVLQLKDSGIHGDVAEEVGKEFVVLRDILKRHSPKKPGFIMSPKHTMFFHIQSPPKPRKVCTLKKLDLNAKVSGDSLGTKHKIMADLEKDCDVRKRMGGDMEVSLNKELVESALQARQES
ncbi:hypothetical protein PanWU01x14_139290 [Parasponia andersonii]|uniref:Uncharacterized protein n=1 Tax=Parasponia andersonii TaxID=3476 RepID=A0A2P5CMX8_PARAD|nr:hypothetical protein PanWU01x14_139290 [Parasponia andersonii]